MKKTGKLYVFFLAAIFSASCHYPYRFLNKKFAIEDQEAKIPFLYIKKDDACLSYSLVLPSPLFDPFVPNVLPRQLRTRYPDDALLLQNHFLWIRIYLKNTSSQIMKGNIDTITVTSDKVTYKAVLPGTLLVKYPYLLHDMPVFWYSLPKKPHDYFLMEITWWRNFYFYPLNQETRKRKLTHYETYFQNFYAFELQPNDEILFYLPFEKLEENRQYEITIPLQPRCRIQVTFHYKIHLENQRKDVLTEQNNYQNLLQELIQQNRKWEEKAKERKEKQIYSEFLRSWKLF